MDNETMDLDQLASYLHRDVREVSKMASRGYLPGHKVGGEWRFASAEINYWIETQMPRYSEEELLRLETGAGRADKLHEQPLIATYLSQSSMAVPLTANTKAAVLKGLVTLAEQTWQVRDPAALLAAVK